MASCRPQLLVALCCIKRVGPQLSISREKKTLAKVVLKCTRLAHLQSEPEEMFPYLQPKEVSLFKFRNPI